MLAAVRGLVGKRRKKPNIVDAQGRIVAGAQGMIGFWAVGTTGRSLPLSSRRLRVIGVRVEVAASGVGSVSGGLGERVALVGE